jgi:hypothetical protein
MTPFSLIFSPSIRRCELMSLMGPFSASNAARARQYSSKSPAAPWVSRLPLSRPGRRRGRRGEEDLFFILIS